MVNKLVLNPPPFLRLNIEVSLRSPKGGCCSISDDLKSCFESYSDLNFQINQTLHQFMTLILKPGLYRITRGFHGVFVTGVANKKGTLTVPGTSILLFNICSYS